MFGIDGIIILLIVTAVVLASISWILGRAEQRRYEEVMRTGEREAALIQSRHGDSPDRAVSLPMSTEAGSGYVAPTARAASHAGAGDATRSKDSSTA